MLGLPKKYLEADLRYGNSGEVRLRGKITPGLVPVERLDSLPDSFPQKEYPRFIGKISSEYSLEDVDGMSGGPIFGLNSKSGWYWIAAIQSSFLEDRGIIFGCPVPLIGAIVEETIKLANSAPDESY